MLQSSMRAQLARLRFLPTVTVKRTIMSPESIGPVKVFMNAAYEELEKLGPDAKHWQCKGIRSVAIAAELLRRKEIIAVPTDTIYGLAGLVNDNESIAKLYKIKRRDESKPLAICVSSVNDIWKWGVTDDIPKQLLKDILPGPYTVILKRKNTLNPEFNPGIDNVGIRVPNSKFIRDIAKFVGPLALTSANVSDKPSSIKPEEFSELWPELGGIFYDTTKQRSSSYQRSGSTIVDLSQSGYYKIIRHGIGASYLISFLHSNGIQPIKSQ